MGFRLINHVREINNSDEWIRSTAFPSKGQLVDEKGGFVDETYPGRKYKIVAQRERNFSCQERSRNVFLGMLLVAGSLGIGLFLKSVRNLITNQKENLGYAILLQSSVPRSQPEKAAVIFQKFFRGRKIRNRFLDRSLFPRYVMQCERAQEPKTKMQRAKGGKTKVFLPQDIPEVVLKKAGNWNAVRRFHEMQEVRTILESQRSSHLVIPKARLCDIFLVEERLPINVDYFHNMGLYVSYPQLFDEPVRELTRLFSRGYIGDLICDEPIPIAMIPGTGGTVRYDNLPLYILEKNGKKEGRIGLVDLEHFDVKDVDPQNLKILVRIFPYHLGIIKEESQKLKMQIDNLDLDLEGAAARGKKFLQVGYIDHLERLREKGVSKTLPGPFLVNSQRAQEVTAVIEKELLRLNQGINDYFERRYRVNNCRFKYDFPAPKNFIIGIPEETSNEIARGISDLILGNLKNLIASYQKEKFNQMSEKEISESLAVGLRSPLLKRTKIFAGIDTFISKNPRIKFEAEGPEDVEIGEQLIYVVLRELEKGGEIFFFDPAYYTNRDEACWIRY